MLNEKDFLASVRFAAQAVDLVALRHYVRNAASMLGFDAVAYLSPLTRNRHDGRILTNDGFPESWARQYQRRLFLIDPIPEYGLQVANAFRWSTVFEQMPLTEAQRRYVKALRFFRMDDGVSACVYGKGGRAGIISFGYPNSSRAFDSANMLLLQLVGQVSFNRYCEMFVDRLTTSALSEREVDVLRHASQGGSNSQIAAALDISAATVATYFKRIMEKLDVSDRTSACIHAAELGYIQIAQFAWMEAVDGQSGSRARDPKMPNPVIG